MEIAYWVVAGLLAVFYAYAGLKKLNQSQEQLQPMMAWAGTQVPMPVVRLIGALEVLGALGLVVPAVTGILPWLSVLAAVCLVVLQVLAAGLHLSRGEAKQTPLNAVLLVLAALAAWLGTTFL